MQQLTEIDIAENRRQFAKDREAEWQKIVRSAIAKGNLLSGNTAIQYIDAGFLYIDTILNSAYSVEMDALIKAKALQPDEYFMTFKDKLFQLTQVEGGIVQSKALAQFQAMGESFRTVIIGEASRRITDRRESILNHTVRIKEKVKHELSHLASQQDNNKKEPLAFISYDTRDIALAHAISDIIKRIFNDRVKTFIAKRDIKPGEDAFKRMLHDSLAKSAVVLAICTRRSLTSPWLWFESGAGFGNCTLIPIWAGVKPDKFKAPMTIFQGKSVEDKAEMEELITGISDVTKVPSSDYSLTVEELDGLKQLTAKLNSISDEGEIKAADDDISNSEIKNLNQSLAALKNEMRRAALKSSLAQVTKRFKQQLIINDKQLDILRFIHNHEHISESELIRRFDDGDRLLIRHDIDELSRLKFIKIKRNEAIVTDAAGRAYLVKKMNLNKINDSKIE